MKSPRKILQLLVLLPLSFFVAGAHGQITPSTNIQGYGLKIYNVESLLYPFVQAYIRTFDQDMLPLVNLNELNIGVMVKGRVYDIQKRQYMVQTLRNRKEAIRAVILLDASKTMAGKPFEEALKASARFIDAKRPQDQIAILALTDNKEGYDIVSNFERNPSALGRRLADVRPNAKVTRLYDGIGAAMQMCASSGQGGDVTGDADYVATCSIIIFSDGKDEASAIERTDLMTRITNLKTPIPIYSLAFTNVEKKYLRNLQALSKNSFGKYYDVSESLFDMTRSVEQIMDILLNDYVVTIRAYVPVDGEKHPLKVGVEYPSKSGKFRYASSYFEAIEPPPASRILDMQKNLNGILKPLKDRNPFIKNQYAPSAN